MAFFGLLIILLLCISGCIIS